VSFGGWLRDRGEWQTDHGRVKDGGKEGEKDESR
jgi:hypothetical protein